MGEVEKKEISEQSTKNVEERLFSDKFSELFSFSLDVMKVFLCYVYYRDF